MGKSSKDPRNNMSTNVPINPPGEGSRSKQQEKGTKPKPSQGKGFEKAN
jgi:hypothetical protein